MFLTLGILGFILGRSTEAGDTEAELDAGSLSPEACATSGLLFAFKFLVHGTRKLGA